MEASTIIQDITAPAWSRFAEFIETVCCLSNGMQLGNLEAACDLTAIHNFQEYEPNTREYEGVWSLPGGDDYYKACLKFHTTTNLSPLEIHQLGLSEVARISGAMGKVKTCQNIHEQ